MKDRIKMIMDAVNLGNNRFAEAIGIAPTLISNIMNGRNKASLDTITAILTAFPQINPDWLLFGVGDMYKNAPKTEKPVTPASTGQLAFAPEEPETAQSPIKPYSFVDESEEYKESVLNQPQSSLQPIVTERVIYKELPERKITRIIVYYSDNTFEVFDTGKL